MLYGGYQNMTNMKHSETKTGGEEWLFFKQTLGVKFAIKITSIFYTTSTFDAVYSIPTFNTMLSYLTNSGILNNWHQNNNLMSFFSFRL